MTVRAIYETMDYGPALESAECAFAWLVDQGDRFGHFIGGAFTDPGAGFLSKNPATNETLATLTQASQADVDAAVTAARRAQPGWLRAGGHTRARHLHALARLLQEHARLFAVLETLDNGKPIRESRDIDVPLAQRHFHYHAGLAHLMQTELPGQVPHGVCGQVTPSNRSLLMLAWKVAPALAAGNTVVLKPDEHSSLTALLFADVCRQAGLPKGVVNIVTGDGRVGEMIAAHGDVDKVAFTGSPEAGRRIRRATAGQGKALTLALGGKFPCIVFDDADLDSAVEGLVDSTWSNGGRGCCAGARLLVQESVADRFHAKLRARMERLRLGNPLDKCIDIGAMADPAQRDRVAALLDATGGARFSPRIEMPAEGCFLPPTLVTGLAPADPLMQEEVLGPVLVSTTFRTPAEAAHLANDTRYGLAASVWSETVALALDMVPRLAAGIVWVNGTHMFDAAAPFGGLRESGNGREGGWEGLAAYLRPAEAGRPLKPAAPFPGRGTGTDAGTDRTAKLYIGGKQTRADAGDTRPLYGRTGRIIGQAPVAGAKDIGNAVAAARAATAWPAATAHQRAQVLCDLAETLSTREAEVAQRLNTMTGGRSGRREVAASVERLFTWAAWADKHDGAARAAPVRGLTLALREPLGVIGALLPFEAPLLGLVSVLGPILAFGNRAVLVASEPFPLAATDFIQILETSDLPAGVANILTGDHADLAPALAAHLDLDAVWSFSAADVSATIERESAGNLKRTWVNDGRARDWFGPAGADRAFREAATEVKTVWIPHGA